MKPIIGILSSIRTINSKFVMGDDAISLNCSYINAIEKGGGIPLVIPVSLNEKNLKVIIERLDGILLSGGIDINPLYYNEEPKTLLGEVDNKLDEFNFISTKIALELNKPILGICRGIQVLNVCLGGTLYQDLSYSNESYIKHMQEAKADIKTHSVDIQNSELLESILGKKIEVNSFHHQSIKELGKDLKVTAISKDGVIEGIEKEDAKFVVGIQWHPELMVDSCNKMLNLFKVFIDNCKNN